MRIHLKQKGGARAAIPIPRGVFGRAPAFLSAFLLFAATNFSLLAAPTGIQLSNNRIAETNAVGSLIGTFTVTDSTPGATHTLSLVSGNDATSFSISGTQLRSGVVFNAETKTVFTILVRATDGSGATLDQMFNVFILDVNESDPQIALPSPSLKVSEGVVGVLGALQATDADIRDVQLASTAFVAADIYNVRALADSLQKGATPAAQFVRGGLSGSTLTDLTAFTPQSTEAQANTLRQNLAIALNSLATPGSSLQSSLGVPQAMLTPRTTELIQLNPVEGDALTLLNRRLLQDAFPEALVNNLVFTVRTNGNVLPGQPGTPFAINPETGELSTTTSLLDYETPSHRNFTLTVDVSDNRGGTSSRQITVEVIDVNEPPEIAYQTFDLDVDSGDNVLAGVVEASDPDADDVLTFSIESGERRLAFEIKADGNLTLTNAVMADLKNHAITSLTIKVTDKGGLSATGLVDIFSRDPDVPGGSPLMARIGGSTIAAAPAQPLPAAIRVESGEDGTLYVLGITGGDPYLNIYSPDFAGLQRVSLSNPTSNLPKFTPRAMALAGEYAFVAGELANGNPHLIRVNLTDQTLRASTNTTLIASGRTISAVAAQSTNVYVAGLLRTGDNNRDHYWARLSEDLTTVGLEKKWGWNDSVTVAGDGKQKFSGVIGVQPYDVNTRQTTSGVTSIALDDDGGVYVAGFWSDSGDQLKKVLFDKFARHDIYDSPFFNIHIHGEHLNHGKRWLGNALPLSGFTHGLNADLTGVTMNFGAIKKPEPAYIAKFNSSGEHTHYKQDSGYETRSRVTDMKVVKTSTGNYLYTVQEYSGRGGLGGETNSDGFLEGAKRGVHDDNATSNTQTHAGFEEEGGTLPEARNVKVNRFASNLSVVAPQNATIKSPGNISARSIAVDRAGNISLVGILSEPSRFEPSPSSLSTSGGHKMFVAQLQSSFNWQVVRLLGLNETYRSIPPALIHFLPSRGIYAIVGNLESGTLELENESDPASQAPAPVNSVSASSGSTVGFLTFVDRQGNFVEQTFLEIESEFGLTVRHVFPWKGRQTAEIGRAYTVEVPEEIYLGPGGEYLGSLEAGTSEEEKRRAVTRYINTGYTVANGSTIGNSRSYTFVLQEDTKITFHWRVEHAVEVASDLTGTGALWKRTGAAQPGAWAMGQEGEWIKEGLYGLTSLAAGNPQPAVQKHWIPANQVFTAFIEGTAMDLSVAGVRYRVTGFTPSGSAALLNQTSWIEQPRQQVPQFVVSGPATLIYHWKPQFRIMVSTSRSKAKDLPQVRMAPGFIEPGSGQRGWGSGEHWFDRGTGVRAGGKSDPALGQLRGWVYGDGPPFLTTSGTALTADGSFSYAPHTTLQTAATPANPGNGLQSPITVAWNYGNQLYPVAVLIGNHLDPASSGASGLPTLTNYRIKEPPTVTVIDAPSGSAAADVQVWDANASRAWPLRPGRFLLEFNHATSPETTDPLVFDVTSSFPVLPHYRHLVHRRTPGVELDPDPQDTYFFQGLRYSEAHAGSVIEGMFTAQAEGRHVLLYSVAPDQRAATGNLAVENLLVRVAESRYWDSTPSEGGLGAWSNTIGIDPATRRRLATGTPAPMLAQSGEAAVIGERLSGGAHDRAGIGTGFVVRERARYNAAIYDRNLVQGPIIPVNQQFTGEAEDELTVVWYERAAGNETKPDNIRWPWQSVSYPDIEWPANPGRIVIASRLGSEGQDLSGADQLSFWPDQYESVRIYHQPNPALPGFNPNEEHALIAPSNKFLDQANPPPTAFALRDGDLNVTDQDDTYTSDPYVLVEYFDIEAAEFKMAVYEIVREDSVYTRTSPYRYPEPVPGSEEAPDGREFPYVFDYSMRAGEPVQPPYPLGFVIGLTPCRETHGENGNVNFKTYWEDYRGQPWAISDGRLFGYFYYPLHVDFWHPNEAPGSCLPFLPPLDSQAVARPDLIMPGDQPWPTFPNGSTFKVSLSGGDLDVTLAGTTHEAFVDAVAALNNSNLTARWRSDGSVVLVWKGADDQITLEDGTGEPLDKAGIYTGFRSRHAFTIEGSVALGSSDEALIASNSNFQINGVTVTIPDPNSDGLVEIDEVLAAIQAAFPPPATLSASQTAAGLLRLQSADGEPIELSDGVGSPLLALGFQEEVHAPPSRIDAQPVAYRAVWPTRLPILKVGETLTFAGGEYRADHPDAPGLPGVVGWAAGELLFDSLNPAMLHRAALEGKYTARFISPLETVTVELDSVVAEGLRERLAPATGLSRVNGTAWSFTGLPASLGRRIYFDPLNSELGFFGLLNDKELGDTSLTATPPPVYVLEPNILTPSERDTLLDLAGAKAVPGWREAVLELYALSRNPEQLHLPGDSKAGEFYDRYQAGLEQDILKNSNGDPLLDAQGNEQPAGATTARPIKGLGPGLAMVPGPQFLDTDAPVRGYVTIVENNDPDLGGPISLFIIKVDRKHRYRGAIKTILSDNVFDEKITLRHSGDFGANADDLVYQWFYREEDGTEAPLPPASPWRLFLDQSDNSIKGLGQYQIGLEGTGGLLLADNLFFVRYRHKNDEPSGNPNGVDWSGLDWERFGQEAAVLDRSGQPVRGPDGRIVREKAGEWAGAGNSPSVDGVYVPQLAMGWIKRVLDRVNPFEARINDFRDTEVPATYASMILQLGQRYEGPVALNPDKNVIENVGLIELYETILDRALSLSLGLSSPVSTPGINTALLLAATRISDFYSLLGNEAYSDAQDPTIGFGSDSSEFGSVAGSIFSFQNQLGSLLDEELALLRGVSESYRRPVYNRLFWNFTKSLGEVAYALNYNITDQNLDGFIDESDAMVLYPQGHGDAWGHYTTALKSHYRLLKHPFFNWISRAERYNLLDVVIDVDYLDERRFAEAAAARARAGAEIVELTYRSRYVAEPDGQWQGYTDNDPDRAWGVQGWARRAGQGALLDWITANALIPSEDASRKSVVNEALKKIDRQTVTSIKTIASNLRRVQEVYNNANSGLNPLGLSDEMVPFDISPDMVDDRVFGGTHFEQVYSRAEQALANAAAVFRHAEEHRAQVRRQQLTADTIFDETYERDRDLRNRLIEIFGTPYAGAIGTGRPYPAGYNGPDLMLFMYVDENDFASGVPRALVPNGGTGNFQLAFQGFKTVVTSLGNGTSLTFDSSLPFFVTDAVGGLTGSGTNGVPNLATVTAIAPPSQDGNVILNMPVTANGYTFKKPPGWGRRAATGELQAIISEMLQAENALAQDLGNYDNYLKELKDMADLLEAKYGLASTTIEILDGQLARNITLATLIGAAQVVRDGSLLGADEANNVDAVLESLSDAMTPIVGLANSIGNLPAKAAHTPVKLANQTLQTVLKSVALVADQVIYAMEKGMEISAFQDDIRINKEGFAYEIREQLKEIEQHLRNEATLRMEIFASQEGLREVSDRYRTTLTRGVALIDEREDFNKGTAVAIQTVRYQDMAFRIFRNDAIQKYRASFDLAAQYAYMAAQAYDYETNLDPSDPASARWFLEQIVSRRVLGSFGDIGAEHTGGLSEILARLRDNYQVLKGRLGINNPQAETGRFSLRQEYFRVGASPSANNAWVQVLNQSRRANLWDVPEFVRYCRPFAPRGTEPEPGLVIEFPTQILARHNFFGRPLAGGDNAYDPSLYATKIRSVGVWFSGYPDTLVSATPRVYLVPAGRDIMTIPNSRDMEIRSWQVMDHSIPIPYPVRSSDLKNPNWIPVLESLSGPLGSQRRFSSFRAYNEVDADLFDPDQLASDTRLVGRSAWNTRWLLIIPGSTLSHNRTQGLDDFISRVTDIKLHFQTYGYSGN